jgi:Tol biopolymer transport system component
VFNGAGGISLIRRDGTGLRRAPGFRLPSLSPDGTQLAFQQPVAFDANGVFVADVTTGQARLLVSPGRDPAWSPDGTRIAYDTKLAIWTIPVAGGQPTRLVTLNGTAEYAGWLGDGR